MADKDTVLKEVRGYMNSRILLTACELDIFTLLDNEPRNASSLARSLQTDARALDRLMDALVAIGYLEKQSSIYSLSEAGSLLSANNPESVLPMVLHLNETWNYWSNLTETVKKGINPQRTPVTEKDEEQTKNFIGAMDVIGRDLARDIAVSYDTSGFQKLLDIGGGPGTYTKAFLQKNPELRAVLFDLPNVISLAEQRLSREGLGDRVEFAPGDFYQDELPSGCDIALLSAIIHQNSPRENLDLYAKICTILPQGGVLLIRDHIMDDTRTRPAAGAIFAINMLVNTAGGDTYTWEEVRDTLVQAGFKEVNLVREGDQMDCLIEAKK